MYSQVKDITRLGDRTCRKCNNEIVEKLSAIYRINCWFFTPQSAAARRTFS
jgi:hypothetical protein